MSDRIASRRPKVLLVDDDASITEFLRRLLADCDVREVHGVREALDVLEREMPAIVVTDLSMDDGGGKYLLAVLADVFPAVRRVVYSAAPAAELLALVESGLAHSAIQKSGDWQLVHEEVLRLVALAPVFSRPALQVIR